MNRVIAYDVMRLFIGPSFMTPRGIDRIELALAQHLFSDAAKQNIGILPTPAGVYAFSASQVRSLLAYVQELWAEKSALSDDSQVQALLNKVARGQDWAPPAPSAPTLSLRNKVWRMLRMLYATNLVPYRLAGSVVPPNAVYLNIGQLGLAMPSFFNWLSKRPDIARAMMVHDAIPIDYPHLVRPQATAHHWQMIRTAAAHADCLIDRPPLSGPY